jgi:hypothetical protein
MISAAISRRHRAPAAVDAAIEFCYERGWTDGLPVVPPTEERVGAFLTATGRAPSEVLGAIPERRLEITVEKAAINAVMAGCRPEYLPVVLTALEAVCDPIFGGHAALAGTAGAAVLLILNGPLAATLGLASRENVLGPGNRPAATIGRAVTLTLRNVAESVVATGFDRATLGHPGRLNLCIAEEPDPAPWKSLHVHRGLRPETSAVSALAATGPRQVYNETATTPEGVLDSIAWTAADAGALVRAATDEFVIILGGRHREILVRAGWTRTGVQYYLHRKAQLTGADLKRAGKTVWPWTPEYPPPDHELFPAAAAPESFHLVLAGGLEGGYSAVIPGVGGGSRLVTRAIPQRDEGLGDREARSGDSSLRSE